jgi:hypothetical protein
MRTAAPWAAAYVASMLENQLPEKLVARTNHGAAPGETRPPAWRPRALASAWQQAGQQRGQGQRTDCRT